MINFNKLGVVTLLFSFVSLSSLYASSAQEVEAVRLAFPTVITTPQELKEYGDDLITLALMNCSLETLDIIKKEPEIKISPITFSDHESYLFKRTYALCTTCTQLAAAEKHQPEKSKNYFLLQIEALDQYLKTYGEFISSVPQFNLRMQSNRYFVYLFQGEAFFNLGRLHENEVMTNETIQSYFKQAIDSYKKALFYGELYKKQPTTSAGSEVHQILLNELSARFWDLKFSLFSTYMTCIQFVPSKEQPDLRRKANGLMKEFQRGNHKEFFKKAQETIKALEKLEESRRLSTNKKGSQKVQQKRSERSKQLEVQARQTVAEMKKNTEFLPRPLKSRIFEMHQVVESLADLNLDASKMDLEGVLQGVKKIEEEIYHSFPSYNAAMAGMKIPFNSLKLVYELYDSFLWGERLVEFIPVLLGHFIGAGNLEGALEKANLLKHLEEKRNGNCRFETRKLIAMTQNLMGNHEDWLALEKEATEHIKKLKEKKKNARLKKRQAQAALIKQQLESKATEAVQEEKREEKGGGVSFPRPVLTDADFDVKYSENSREAKDEKQRRHEETEKKREELKLQKGKEKVLENRPEPVSKKSEKENTTLDLPEEFSLCKLYGLTSTAKEIDESIEQNAWDFTRDDLKLYYEAMGCQYKSGKGSHKKAAMPKATLVMQGDQLITIMNDFGGALTLPQWSGKHVPYYLRLQIIVARKKLAAHRLRILKDVANSSGTPQ